ncbi:unnamed protein product [Effrenium voratum]|uniref:Uncharacterized protein n=1 Tax=Effrenium voratum TaxID=2562239 RepID=A0AA36HVL2_9DINO|nr:unnamed protein product [Effrenium voratum]
MVKTALGVGRRNEKSIEARTSSGRRRLAGLVAGGAACRGLWVAARGGATQWPSGNRFSAAMQKLFGEAGRPVYRAALSPVQISKPVLGVESAELEASQDALVASLGTDELRAMHLADVCLANNHALRRSELPHGLAASAAAAAAAAATADFWATELRNDISCALRRNGEVAVVFLTCADADLAFELARLLLDD